MQKMFFKVLPDFLLLLLIIAALSSCVGAGVEDGKPAFDERVEKILQQYKDHQYSENTNINGDTTNNAVDLKTVDADGAEKQSPQFETQVERNLGKKLSIPAVGASESPRNDNVHDSANDAITVLQSPVNAMHDFPRDRRQQVDWVQALDQGLISPRANLTGGDEMVTMDMDIVMKNTQFMPWVKFPHIAHTKWLACENCHPKIFIPQENANPISMNKVLRGEYCGVCHDKVAFALFICERCHSVPHAGSGPKWW